MALFPQRNPSPLFYRMKKSVGTACIFQDHWTKDSPAPTGKQIKCHRMSCPWLLPLWLHHSIRSLSFTPTVRFCSRPGQVEPRKCLPCYRFLVSPAFIWLCWVPILGNLTSKGTRVREGFGTEESIFYSLAHLWWLKIFVCKGVCEDPTLST